MMLAYSEQFKKYILHIQSSQNFCRGRIFIPVDIEVDFDNYHIHSVSLSPYLFKF